MNSRTDIDTDKAVDRLCSTSNIVTPDKKTWCPVKSINIKVNIFWEEEYRKEQIDLTIPQTSSYGLFKKAISEKLEYGISNKEQDVVICG
ncbi:hypothetical protein GLOIN_2v1716736 [Rhizophagus clarus]|uniref:Uncharacterized protein n=1 Tax=Rhizophagus clarus TaxID=94130 RepID=A0A8H3KZZ0_9GLOM|nr:hypothetical protein GLOIN_2v1716736 [Rhizophagus clarus]